METISVVQEVLRTGGLDPALRLLNARVPHRFTAVYQINGDFMRNVAIVDKAGEIVPDNLLAVPITASFCQFVLRDGFFLVDESNGNRPELDGHPYKGAVNSYVGVPLTRDGQDLIGTFCHFDFPPLPVADGEFELMQQVAKVLPPYVTKPGTLGGTSAASALAHLQAQRAVKP